MEILCSRCLSTPKTMVYSVLHLFLSPASLLKNPVIFFDRGKNLRRKKRSTERRRGRRERQEWVVDLNAFRNLAGLATEHLETGHVGTREDSCNPALPPSAPLGYFFLFESSLRMRSFSSAIPSPESAETKKSAPPTSGFCPIRSDLL